MKYSHLATRIFGVPLLIERNKLDVILAAIAPRLGIQVEEPAAYGPGDTGRSRKSYYVTEDGIGIIDIVGPLVKRQSGGFMSGGPTTYGEIESEFADAVNDPAIKGIILQIDSPGGEVTGCFELADAIYAQRGSKPIIAAADGDAFSAAYAIASSADQIFVTKTGGVGSIGVWMMHVDQSAYNEKEGFKPTYVFAGSHKVDGNPHEPLTKESRQALQDIVDGSYEMFVDTVARNRGMSAKSVRATEAALYWGQPKRGEASAVDAGLVDRVGTLNDALTAMRERIQSDSSRVAQSATNPTKKEGIMPETNEGADATLTAPASEVAPLIHGEPLIKGVAAPFGHAVAIVQACALAGLTARAALRYLNPEASIESVRTELMEAQAADSGPEISSHLLPDSGITASKPEESRIVKACEQLAQKEGK